MSFTVSKLEVVFGKVPFQVSCKFILRRRPTHLLPRRVKEGNPVLFLVTGVLLFSRNDKCILSVTHPSLIYLLVSFCRKSDAGLFEQCSRVLVRLAVL